MTVRHVWLVARVDWQRRWRDRGTRIIVSVLFVLLVLASGAGLLRVRAERQSAVDAAAREGRFHEALLRGLGGASGVSAATGWNLQNPDFLANDRGTLAVAETPSLAVLSVGQSASYPSEIKVTAAASPTATTLADLAHPLGVTLGAFDVEFIVVFLWPLAIIALASDLLVGERERGTLPLLLAQPVAPTSLMLGWLLGRGLPALLPVLVASGLAASLASNAVSPVAFALWSLSLCAYALFWLGLSLWVATLSRSAASATMWMSGAWLLCSLVVPGAIQLIAATWSAVPSDVVFADATRSATRDALTDGSRVLGHFLEDHPTAAAVGRDGLRQYALLQAARDQEVARRMAPLIAQFGATVERQRRLVSLLRPLSPALVTSDVLEQVAGTSSERGRDFLGQVDAFRSEWQAFFAPRILAGQPVTAADVSMMPRFVHRAESWQAVTRRLGPGLAWLGGLGIGFTWLAARRVTRFPLGRG